MSRLSSEHIAISEIEIIDEEITSVCFVPIHYYGALPLRQPGINHGVDRTLARGKVTSDIADEVESLLLTVHVELYACCQHTDSRTDSRHHRHRQHRSYGLNRFTDTLRHLGQTVVVETLILLYYLVQITQKGL